VPAHDATRGEQREEQATLNERTFACLIEDAAVQRVEHLRHAREDRDPASRMIRRSSPLLVALT
jgi:hypothetical protein